MQVTSKSPRFTSCDLIYLSSRNLKKAQGHSFWLLGVLVWKMRYFQGERYMFERKFKISLARKYRIVPRVVPRVVPLSLSPSCVTREKIVRKKWPRKILGARSTRKEGPFACFSPPGFHADVFPRSFRVTHDGQSERGTTRSLSSSWVSEDAMGY